VFKKHYNGNPNVTVWPVYEKTLHLKAYKLSIVQVLGRWIVCTPLSVNVSVTFATPVFASIELQATLNSSVKII
jgi:hypothetical protein